MSTLHLPWDSYDAYLFDIDGTLLRCRDAVHYFAFCHVLSGVAGRAVTLDGVVAHGNVDPGILRDAMAQAGVPDEVWRPHRQRMQQQLAEHVESRAAEFAIDVLPGVREVLAHLQSRGALLGVATGNLERIGWAKLRSCGLADEFSFGGFSDAYEYRGELIRGAVQLARSRTHPHASVCVVGDTPSDIRAAREAGVDVIAVATGVYAADHLRDADLVVTTLQELLQG